MSCEGRTPVRDAETSLSSSSGKRAGSVAPTSQGMVALTLAEFRSGVAEEVLWNFGFRPSPADSRAPPAVIEGRQPRAVGALSDILVPVLQRLLDQGHELVG